MYEYLSAIETFICRREISLIGSTSFGFAQNALHDFLNTLLNSSTNATKMAEVGKNAYFYFFFFFFFCFFLLLLKTMYIFLS